MEAGIVGLPYTGKTTLFKALTGQAVDPSGGVKPNVGVVQIPDPRLDILARHIPTKKITHAQLKIVDIPGLVRGSSKGEGLGNAFLSHIREIDATIHVVRCFTHAPGGEEVPHVDGSLNPARDIQTVELELILADLQQVEGSIPRAEKAMRQKSAEAAARLAVLQKVLPILSEGKPAHDLKLTDPEEKKAMKGLALVSSKPVLYVANVDEDDLAGAGALASQVRAHAEAVGAGFVPVCARIEAELAELAPADRAEMLTSLGIAEPALHTLARAAYRLLGLQSFYTAGEKEVRAWTIPVGATAPQAAGAIHTDFERGFIRVEVYSVGDLEALHSEKAIKEAGKMRMEGKGYVMHDADVCHFLFNV
ncbi:MAG: redox-regulated ATPase YchF [Phycisphaerae bacterium]|nr:redox-regulated ATPase YchF [Phycisphaerae bacterium]